ncbi:hypothetical protein EXE51_14845 [Halorubrum sp. CGM5_25_10-8B]|jgi:hypothetical protein|nr:MULTISPECIES: hypothetical protein [Halorubrum]MDB9235006.1 hypothetical protein [Halorubrum ezzemoulense]TKX35353.1 hypothetical protein EXE51_14845 [Halorubrum sp. CGM5_25_10-8B]
MTTALQADANSAGKDSPAPAKLYEKELLAKLIVVCEHKMSRRSRRGIVAGLTTALAGCGGLLPGYGDSSSTPPTESGESTTPDEQGEDNTSSTTESNESTSSTQEEDTNDQSASVAETDYPTSDVLLSVPELGEGYNLTGETQQAQSSSDGDELDTLREAGIVRQHERSFRLETNDSDRASVVFSSVTVYESSDIAKSAADELLTSIRDSGGSVEDQNVLSGVSASVAVFENAEGALNTLFARRSGPVQYYVVTSDQAEYFRDQTHDLFVRMVTATPD